MMLNSSADSTHRAASSSKPGRSSKRSTKPTKPVTAKPAAARPWKVKLHREVGKDVTHYGLSNPNFTPTLADLIGELERDPKQFPKKKGQLQGTRAAELKYYNVVYRADFTLDEAARLVFIVSLEPHDKAYEKAKRRLTGRRKR